MTISTDVKRQISEVLTSLISNPLTYEIMKDAGDFTLVRDARTGQALARFEIGTIDLQLSLGTVTNRREDADLHAARWKNVEDDVKAAVEVVTP